MSSPRNNRCDLPTDLLLKVARYFKEPRDYINLMKVTRKYYQFFMLYNYNPISNTTLFRSICTQHLYTKNDKLERNVLNYVDWTVNDRVYNNGKVFMIRDAYKHVIYNVPLLEEWTGLTYDRVLFDTQDSNIQLFPANMVTGTNNIYIILVDFKNNIFGFFLANNNVYGKIKDVHYVSGKEFKDIGNTCIMKSDPNDFMFSLNSAKCIKKKYKYKQGTRLIYDIKQSELYDKIYIDFFSLRLFQKKKTSSVSLSMIMGSDNVMMSTIDRSFKKLLKSRKTDALPNLFSLKRIILVKMSD